MAVQEKAARADERHVETESAMNRSGFAYSPLRFFQVMLAVAWSAFAHPFTTVIDLETGRAYKENGEERP
jgi:hypothetical protein